VSYPILSSSVKWKLESYKKTPVFNTVVQKNAAGRGVAATSLKPYPTWEFNVELPMNVSASNLLTSSSIISQFIGLLGELAGQGGLFLYSDYTDNSVTTAMSGMLNVTSGAAAPMGTVGDGSSTEFQLVRSLGGLSWDIIQNLNGAASIYVNGTLKTNGTDYSISSTGVVTFASAPANNATLTWSGNFYFLCRLGADSFKDLSMVGYNASGALWTCTGISFASEFV
jgi:uncharacterized protein (TIGR02217 family)